MDIRMTMPGGGYSITIENGALSKAGLFADLERKVLIVTDDGVPMQYAQRLQKQCFDGHIMTLRQGEESKSFAVLEEICARLLELGFGRGDLVAAVGGGMTGDIAGLASAVYMRGVEFLNVPTTTLSQLDSAMGGKTALNMGGVKNAVGAFHRPIAVIIDPELLSSLPRRHFANGMAEGIKAALIGDKDMLTLFENGSEESNIYEIIYRAVVVKKRIVERDELEGSVRRALNLGHTVGHGIESVCGLLHGESIALGMLPMIEDPALKSRVCGIYKKLGLPVSVTYDGKKVMELIAHDKKAQNGVITIVKVQKAGSFHFEKLELSQMEKYVRDGIR